MKLKTARKPLGNQGQSTLEFALSLFLLFGFTLFFIQISLVMAWGNYVHYATYMSARAYLSSGPSKEDQSERARYVIIQMVKKGQAFTGTDRYPLIGRAVGGGDPAGFTSQEPSQYQHDARFFSWLEGVRYTFKSRLFLIPFGKAPKPQGNGNEDVNSVTLTSESWLGRDPSSEECRQNLDAKQARFFDNGC